MMQNFFLAKLKNILGLSFLCLMAAASLSFAENDLNILETSQEGSQDLFRAVRYIRWNEDGTLKSETIAIKRDTSQVFRFERPIIRAAISNPAICDITTAGERDILINAKEAGVVNLIVWDQNDNVATYSIDVTLDIKKLQNILRNIDPAADIKIIPFNRTAAIYGTTETSVKLKQMTDAAKAFDEKSLMYVKIRDPKQVLLEVRFAEVKRVGNKDFKLDLDTIFDSFLEKDSVFHITSLTGQNATISGDSTFAGLTQSQALAADSEEVVPDGVTSTSGNLGLRFINNRGALIFPVLKWLESKNLLKIIARPNLVAKDGEEAHFLVGGEFPVPTTSVTGVSITYREFGNDLKFTPEILDNGIIRLKITSIISELDFSTTVTSGGTTVPAILKKQYSSVSELMDNETLVIGGFMSQKVNKVVRKMPILGDLPILKTLFKAEEYSRTDNELLVIITPHLIKPMKLDEGKIFFDEKKIKEAVRQFTPEYPDVTGDTINTLFNQEEERRVFKLDQAEIKKFEKSVASEINKTKVPPKKKQEFYKPAPAPKKSPAKPAPAKFITPEFSTFGGSNDKPLNTSSVNKGVFKGGYFQ